MAIYQIGTTSKVTNMGSMFTTNSAFNGNISGWDTSLVTNMHTMFHNSTLFNNDISTWCVVSVTSYSNFNAGSALSAANLPPFGTSTNCN